jgi:hypothetical protein
MAKTLEVKRFRVLYKGEFYGPREKNGPVIPGVDDATAAGLVASSNGTIVEQPKAKKLPSKAADQEAPDNGRPGGEEAADDAEGEKGGDAESASLPPVQNAGRVPPKGAGKK